MPDRNLREVQLSQAHRLAAMESKQRAMTTRVWPGAMRTASADQFTPLDYNAFNTIIQVETLPGRWLVMGQFFMVYVSPASLIRAEFKLAAFDSISGMEETSDDYDFPLYHWSQSATTLSRQTVTLVGHFSNETDVNKNVTIQCRDALNEAWTTEAIRLRLIPR